MTHTLWSHLLPLPIGTHAAHHGCLSLHLPDDPDREALEQSFIAVSLKFTTPMYTITCPSCWPCVIATGT